MLNNNDFWFDSSLYEVFVYRKLHQNAILKNISLIATREFWNNASNIDKGFPNSVIIRFTSSLIYNNFTVNSSSTAFEGFHNRSIPKIVRNDSIIFSSSWDVALGDYAMNVQAIWQGVEIAESDVIIHVVDPLPRALPVPGL